MLLWLGSCVVHSAITARLMQEVCASGRERFRIKKVVEERPVLVCEVEYLPTEEKEAFTEEVWISWAACYIVPA